VARWKRGGARRKGAAVRGGRGAAAARAHSVEKALGVEQGKGEGVGVAERQVGRCTSGMLEVEVSCLGSGAGGRHEAEVYRV